MLADLWPAFLLGLVGSLHCAGMCGPLALALPPTGNTRLSFTAGRLVYNLGRVTTYCLLGLLFGLVGMTFALAGLQRWASIGAGTAILAGLLAPRRFPLHGSLNGGIGWLRSQLAGLLQRRTLSSVYCLGILNGFLPCGLVYAACAGAVAAGGLLPGMAQTLAFGLGTVPMMLGIGFAGRLIHLGLRLKFQRLIPACLVMVGVLLLLRGMALGIPYVSPALSAHSGHAHCPACQ